MKNYLVWIVCLILIPGWLKSEVLLQTQESWDGGEIYYPSGQAEITSFILRIEQGEIPRFHCHPVPTMGYVLTGSVEIETKSGKKTILNEGESAVEVMRTVHRGRAIDGPVEIVVFYAGSTDLPNTVFLEEENSDEHCKLK